MRRAGAGSAADDASGVAIILETFRALKAQGIKPAQPLRHNAVLNINLAFVTDPWGTSIELTEGLSTLR